MDRGDGGGGMGQRGVMPSAAAMLGMEMHMAHPPQMQHPAIAAFQQPDQHHGGGVGFPLQPVPVRQQAPPPSYSPYPVAPSRGVQASGHEEEVGGAQQQQQQQPGVAAGCPWSRMKWTDGMVRLLITVVYNAGDDGEGVSGGGGRTAAAHGKAGASAAAHGHGGHGQAAAQQKKGKWKSVSRSMMENGFMVSPQQCEDKFNDLNKRYKRVVDLLGRGKACKVVENPALLDAMDELTPKAKEEARKLLSSKHLFFREMCTYHNSGSAAPSQSFVDGAACFHHPPPTPVAGAAASSAARQVAIRSPAMMNSSARPEAEEDEDIDDVHTSKEAEEDDDEDEYDDDEEHRGGHVDVSHSFHHRNGYRKRRRGEDGGTAEEEKEDGNKRGRRAVRAGEEAPSAVQQLQSELAAAAACGDPQQVRQWMRRRAVEVEEQQVVHECRAYQLERQRLKWERFRASKERDMERARLRNDRLRIEGRRMLLLLRHKELDLEIAEANYSSSVDHHPGAHTPPPLPAFPHQQQLGSSPSTTAGHPN